nr:reverse transcriptase domain-containing protein [Tanacetum cinerariifolium]
MKSLATKGITYEICIRTDPVDLGSFDVIIGMDWLANHHAMIVCDEKIVRILYGDEVLIVQIEAIKDENFRTEDLCRMIKKLEQRTDGTLCLNKRSWIPYRVSRHGVPVLIISDQDSKFASQFWESLNKAIGKLSITYFLVEVGDAQLTGPEIIHETTDKIIQIKKRIQATRDKQKSYADKRCKPLEFEVGDKVMLKVSPWKGVVRFGKRGKLNPRYIGPFKILAKVGTLAYRIELPEQLSRVYSTFHVSNLKKCFVDEPLTFPLDEIQIDDKLNFIEEPVKIMDQKVKRLKKIRILIVKDSCNQWGVVIDVYIAAKRSKSGHRFGFVRFKNINDINQFVSNLRVTWMDGFHLFVDVAKYGRTNNRLEERSRDNKPSEVGVSGNNDASNSREKPVRVSVSNKANEESSNEALMFISKDDCIDLDGMKRCILAIVKDLSVITDLLKYMYSEGFVDVGLSYVGGRWVWLEFDSTDQVESVKNSKALEVYKKLGGRWGCNVFTDMVNDGPLSHGKEPLDVDNCDLVSSKDDNNDSDLSSEMSSTSQLMREVGVRGVDSDHVDSFEKGKIIGDSVLNNDGCVKDCMEKILDDDVEKDIEYCSKNVSEKCRVINNNVSNNVEGEILEDQFDEDLSSLDRSSDKAERLAHHNNGLDDLDISLRNRLLHQDKCRVRPVKAAVNDSSIVSPSTPPGTVLNLAEESCSTWLDYVGPLITDELDSKKRWSY